MDLDVIFAMVRVFAGAVIAAHGAQKVFGLWNGPGLSGFTQWVGSMRIRPAGAWAAAAAWGELAGGILLALGLFTGIVAGVLVLDMIVAMWKVHWDKGFWIANGGMEYALTNAVIFGAFGVAGPGAWSIDGPLGLAAWTLPLFAATLVLGLLGLWASARPEAVERLDEARRRRAA